MLTAILIDDEPHARQSLAGLLELYCPSVAVVGRAGSVEEGLALIRQLQPQLVFLDIEIGERTGFDLLEQLETIDFQLIFTTAHSDYAVRAFRYHAIDYLLKPVEPAQLQEAVKKASDKGAPRLEARQLESLIKSLADKKLEKLTIASSEGYHFIEVDRIVRIAGEGHYATFFLQGGEKVVASKSLKTFEDLLPAGQFIKVHQSHLVNIQFVKKLLFQDGSSLLLDDGSQVPLARRRKEAVLAALGLR